MTCIFTKTNSIIDVSLRIFQTFAIIIFCSIIVYIEELNCTKDNIKIWCEAQRGSTILFLNMRFSHNFRSLLHFHHCQYGERVYNSCFLRKSIVYPTHCHEKIELVASRDQQNVFSRLKSYIKLLYPGTIFLEGALLL